MTKRVFDLAAALVGILLLSPVLIAIAIAIKVDSRGPVLYRALRIGKDGRPFAMLKFRTMVDGGAGAGPRVTARDDPRVTRLGRWLRDTKLNELPQLFNVLKGEMSLVGPRPEDPEFVACYSLEERRVLSVLPGITSPAAILYRHEEAMLSYHGAAQSYLCEILPQKLRLDLMYVQLRSFLLDLDVLVRTLLVLIPVWRQEADEATGIFFGPIQRLVREELPWLLADSLTALAAVLMVAFAWRSRWPLDLGWPYLVWAGLGLALAFRLANRLLGLQHTAWRYASAQEMPNVAMSAGLAVALLLGTNHIVPLHLPADLLLAAGCLALAGFVAIRYRSRLLSGLQGCCRRLVGAASDTRERVLVVGGGEAGHMAIWMLQNGAAARLFRVVGVVDDDPRKRGVRIRRVRVLGDRTCIPRIVKEQRIDLIVFAIHHIDANAQEAILEICRATPAGVVVMPNVVALLAPKAAAGEPRHSSTPQGAAPHTRYGQPSPLSPMATRTE